MKEENRFKVLTFNLAKFYSRLDKKHIMDQVLKHKPDLIALQEVDQIRTLLGRLEIRGAKKFVLNYLKSKGYETKWHSASRESFFSRIFSYIVYSKKCGSLIAFNEKFKLLSEKQYRLSKRFIIWIFAVEKRILHHLNLTHRKTKTKINFLNTHLTFRDSEKRAEEINKFRNVIDKKNIYILAGDFNTKPDTPEYLKLIKMGFTDTFRFKNKGKLGYTWEADNSLIQRQIKIPLITRMMKDFKENQRVDYIFIKPANKIKIISSDVILDKKYKGENLSDHYGVLTEFEIL